MRSAREHEAAARRFSRSERAPLARRINDDLDVAREQPAILALDDRDASARQCRAGDGR
jgi:hypothetical protein